jgi:hypothetical protein
MARRYVQGVSVHVKMDRERCTVGVQKMGTFQRAENMEVRKKPHEITRTYVRMMKCVFGRAWVGIPAPVAPRLCSTNLEYKSLDSMRVYKRVAYSRFLLG